MTQRIFKYKLPEPGTDAIYEIGSPSKPLFIAHDPLGDLCVWVMTDADSTNVDRIRFFIIGTGHVVPVDCIYAGSYIAADGPFVWHLMWEIFP